METTKGWKVRRESDGKRVGRVMESKSGEDGKCVGVRCAIAQGGSCGVRTHGTTRVRKREEPMVRWRSGMAHHCQAPHGHGIATSKVNMGIIVKFSVALPCVKSPVSRTAGPILRGDASEKRFSTHAVERNVTDAAQEWLSDGTGCSVTWVGHGTLLRGHFYRIPSQGTDMGLCHG